MNREELKNRINDLPEFELRDVQVLSDGNEWVLQTHKAICEKGGDGSAVAFCWQHYKLVQFKEIFDPVLESIDGDVDGYIATYGGYANFTFYPEDERLKINNNKLGLVVVNSVDLSSSIIIRFCVNVGDYKFVIPSSIAGLKKQHKGNIKNLAKNYIDMVSRVKDVWLNIVTEFPKYRIVMDAEKEVVDENDRIIELGTVLAGIKIGERLSNKIKDDYNETTLKGNKYTLWDLFEKVMTEVSGKEYKSDVHREKKVEAVCNAVYQYSTLLSI